MTETELLKNLQLLDTRIDTLENRLQEIESEITDDSEVVEADNIHKAVCLKFDGLSSNRRSLERTVSDLTLRQSSINDRMYDGTIQNEKEFESSYFFNSWRNYFGEPPFYFSFGSMAKTK